MKRYSATLFVLALVMVLLVPFAAAQSVTRGSIGGVVRDPSNAVVANATITLKSPTGDQKTMSGANGEYVFSNLVVGAGYELSVEKSGFSTAKSSNLVVSLNQRTTADVALQVGSTATLVDVTASATAGIDLQSTSVGANINEDLYKNVPTGRNISSIIQFAPGVADSAGAGTANPSINGASGLENSYSIDGADVTDPGFGGFGTYSRVMGSLGNGVNFDFVKEVQVKSGGFEAQYGQALGGVVLVETKSGSNAFHGSIYGYFQPEAFEAFRPDANALYVTKSAAGYLTHVASFDYGGDVGGYFKKDKIFFYGGVNPTLGHNYVLADPLFANYKLGVQDEQTTTYNYVGKITYQLASKHSVEGEVFGDPASTNVGPWGSNVNTIKLTSSTTPDTVSNSSLDYGSRTWSARYTGALSSKWVLTANYSNHYNEFTQNPLFNGFRISDTTPVQEGKGSNATYGGLGFTENYTSSSKQFNVTSSHTFGLWGSHALDLGFQFQDQPYDDFQLYSGGDFALPNLPVFKDAAGALQHGAQLTRTHLITSDPTSPVVYQVTRGNYSSPVIPTGGKYTSGFIQDAWSIGRHLTLKPGLRFEQQQMSGTYSRYVFGHNWAPRIGAIYDPMGDRKSKIIFNWGRFYEKIPSDISIRAFSFETSVLNTLYKDAGAGNQPVLSAANYVPGRVTKTADPLQNTPNLAFSGTPADTTLVYGGTGAQYQDEFIAGYEKEFSHGLTFSGHFIYRDLKRVLEDTSGINVTQYLAGVPQQYVVANPSAGLDIFKNSPSCTVGSAGCISYDDPFNPGKTIGFKDFGSNPLGSDGVADGFPNPKRTYTAMELIVSRRFSNGFQLFANYTLSSLDGNYQGNFRSDNGQQDPNISSLFDFTNTDNLLGDQYKSGPLPSDRRHQVKIFGNYTWKGINIGTSWRILSGTPISKLLDHPGYTNSGEIPVGGRGSLGRSNVQFPLDVHLDYAWKWKEHATVKFLADMFNIGNQVTPINFNQTAEINGSPGSPNPDFLKPASASNSAFNAYTTPFRARLGIRFEF